MKKKRLSSVSVCTKQKVSGVQILPVTQICTAAAAVNGNII